MVLSETGRLILPVLFVVSSLSHLVLYAHRLPILQMVPSLVLSSHPSPLCFSVLPHSRSSAASPTSCFMIFCLSGFLYPCGRQRCKPPHPVILLIEVLTAHLALQTLQVPTLSPTLASDPTIRQVSFSPLHLYILFFYFIKLSYYSAMIIDCLGTVKCCYRLKWSDMNSTRSSIPPSIY
jgi:hypothetical protein